MSTYPLFDLEEGDDKKRLASWQKDAVASVWTPMKEDATPQDIIDYLIQYLVIKPGDINTRNRPRQEVTEDILNRILRKPVKCLKVFGKALCHEDYCCLHLAELFHEALELQKLRAESSTMSPGNTSNGSGLSDTAAMEVPPCQDHSVHFGQQCEQEEETVLPFPQQYSMVNDDESYEYSGNGRQPFAAHNRAAAAAGGGAVSSTAGVGLDFPDGAAASAAAVSHLPADLATAPEYSRMISDECIVDLMTSLGKWQAVALHLGLTARDIEEVEHHGYKDLSVVVNCFLIDWRNKKGSKATYGTLLRAMMKAANSQAAIDVVCSHAALETDIGIDMEQEE